MVLRLCLFNLIGRSSAAAVSRSFIYYGLIFNLKCQICRVCIWRGLSACINRPILLGRVIMLMLSDAFDTVLQPTTTHA